MINTEEKETTERGMIGQEVVLLPHSSRVQGLILGSGYCLYEASHVLPVSMWISSHHLNILG